MYTFLHTPELNIILTGLTDEHLMLLVLSDPEALVGCSLAEQLHASTPYVDFNRLITNKYKQHESVITC